jgi:hypothetical protein
VSIEHIAAPADGRVGDVVLAELEGVQLAVLNERAVDYSDAPEGGKQQNRDSFAAHLKSLMPALDTWEAAVQGLENASQSLHDPGSGGGPRTRLH